MNPVKLTRETKETQIYLALNLQGTGEAEIETGIGFFDHMLTLFAFHGLFDLTIHCKGDTQVDDHHTIEDVGILLGQALFEALPEKKNYSRYGSVFLPMDETLARAGVDLSGRPFFVLKAQFNREKVGDFSTEMVEEFFRAFAFHAKITLHLAIEYGQNEHHKIEALFKATARALAQALEINPRRTQVASSKGII